MFRAVIFLLTLSALMLACTTMRAIEPAPVAFETPQATSTPEAASASDIPAATATVTPRPAVTPEPEPLISEVLPGTQATATPHPEPLISEVLPETQPPQAVVEPTPVRGGTEPAVPAGTSVVWGGCASDSTCYPYNFYWAPTHEVVMQPGEGEHKVQHELGHAHQHWSISGGAALPPSDYDLASWYETAEAQSFTAAVARLPWPWTHSAVNGLEDFAWTYGYWYLDAAYLLQVSPERYAWAAEHLP
ncbi:MAG: hypothetical protein IH866_05575 [Chloroflexi bacterium]|nr:hypothetical protein [Chloroflexota bacterium]